MFIRQVAKSLFSFGIGGSMHLSGNFYRISPISTAKIVIRILIFYHFKNFWPRKLGKIQSRDALTIF